MDLRAYREAVSLLATMIGEIMEDNVDSALALAAPQPMDWSTRLSTAGEDIAVLGRALGVIGRRAGDVDLGAVRGTMHFPPRVPGRC